MSYRRNTNESASEVLDDPLSSVTRSTRRNLLIFSTICLIISITGINPDGLKLPIFDVNNLPESYIAFGLLALTVFSFINFLVYLIPDFYRFRHKKDIHDLEVAYHTKHIIDTPPDLEQDFMDREFEEQTGYKPFYIPSLLTKVIYFLKMFLDFIFPVLYAFLAIYFYLSRVV